MGIRRAFLLGTPPSIRHASCVSGSSGPDGPASSRDPSRRTQARASTVCLVNESAHSISVGVVWTGPQLVLRSKLTPRPGGVRLASLLYKAHHLPSGDGPCEEAIVRFLIFVAGLPQLGRPLGEFCVVWKTWTRFLGLGARLRVFVHRVVNIISLRSLSYRRRGVSLLPRISLTCVVSCSHIPHYERDQITCPGCIER